MIAFSGSCLSWTTADRLVTVELHHAPANEIGSATLEELERLADALPDLEQEASALVIHSTLEAGFSAGADLRELAARRDRMTRPEAVRAVHAFLKRIHRVFDALDSTSLTTVAAVHGVVFGGGLELALTCDLIVADRMARFAFPELRLGLIPGFGGLPRLNRDVGNAVVRDLLLTGRSINAERAHAVGLVSQLAAPGRALDVARACGAQANRFDRVAAGAGKAFAKRIPREELDEEIELFCSLFGRPEVEEALRDFVARQDAMPYLPSRFEERT